MASAGTITTWFAPLQPEIWSTIATWFKDHTGAVYPAPQITASPGNLPDSSTQVGVMNPPILTLSQLVSCLALWSGEKAANLLLNISLNKIWVKSTSQLGTSGNSGNDGWMPIGRKYPLVPARPELQVILPDLLHGQGTEFICTCLYANHFCNAVYRSKDQIVSYSFFCLLNGTKLWRHPLRHWDSPLNSIR